MSKTTPSSTIAAEVNRDPLARARIEEQKRAMDDALALQELRDRTLHTEDDPDLVLDLTEVTGSAARRGDEIYLATLQRYVAEMGGRLVVEAVFPGMRVNLLRSSDMPATTSTSSTNGRASSASPA